jgi:23S rRNA pseudouridine2605 synthase
VTAREPQRIAKLLARAGIASRREVERMIAEGRIAIDGAIVETPATLLTSLHGVTVDGKPVKAPAPARLFRFHKPVGLLTTERDPKGRPTIYDRLPEGLPRLMPVGRLDFNTEGLLLLTNDGGLKRELELPATGVERTYRARAFGEISQERLEQLFDGIEIDGIRYGPIDANLERRTGRNQWIEMKLREGKNREVRRVLEHLGLEVSRLIRTAYGPFELADLPSGAVDEIRQHDLIVFRKSLGTDSTTIERSSHHPARTAPTGRRSPAQSARGAQPARGNRQRPFEDRSEGARAGRPSHGKGDPRAARASRSPRREDEPRAARAGQPRNTSDAFAAARSGRSPQREDGTRGANASRAPKGKDEGRSGHASRTPRPGDRGGGKPRRGPSSPRRSPSRGPR